MAEMAQTRISRKVKTQMKEKTIPIHKERLIKNFQRLVSIDAPSFGERRMADVLKEELESLGFTVEEDGSVSGKILHAGYEKPYERILVRRSPEGATEELCLDA